MDKRIIQLLIFIVVLVVSFALLSVLSGKNNVPAVVFLTESGEVSVPVEVADTPEERERGLMLREQLDGGMLFVFEQETKLGFWMKNTLIPLDIIFISQELEVVDIQTMIPCEQDPCPVHYSSEPALYALEVNSGFAGENGIQQGGRVGIHTF